MAGTGVEQPTFRSKSNALTTTPRPRLAQWSELQNRTDVCVNPISPRFFVIRLVHCRLKIAWRECGRYCVCLMHKDWIWRLNTARNHTVPVCWR